MWIENNGEQQFGRGRARSCLRRQGKRRGWRAFVQAATLVQQVSLMRGGYLVPGARAKF